MFPVTRAPYIKSRGSALIPAWGPRLNQQGFVSGQWQASAFHREAELPAEDPARVQRTHSLHINALST